MAGEAQTTVVEQAGPSGIAFPAPPTDVVNLDNLPYQWIRDLQLNKKESAYYKSSKEIHDGLFKKKLH